MTMNGNCGFKKHVDDILFDHGKKCNHSCVWIHLVVGVLLSIARGAQFAVTLLWIVQINIQGSDPTSLARNVFGGFCFQLGNYSENDGASRGGSGNESSGEFGGGGEGERGENFGILEGNVTELRKMLGNHSFLTSHPWQERVTNPNEDSTVALIVFISDAIFFFLGVLVGNFLLLSMCDKFGRQSISLVTAWTMGAMSLLQPWISLQALFSTVRFFVGFSFAGSGAVKLWVSEIVPFQQRSTALLSMDAAFFLSLAVTSVAASVVCSWRLVVVAVALLPFLTLPLSCFTAESFKWLESRNEFSLYPRVFARFVDEGEIEALRGKTKTCKISEKDKRWRRGDEGGAYDDEDLCFKQVIRSSVSAEGFKQRRRPASSPDASTNGVGESTALSRNFPMTANHLRRLNRRADTPTSLAPLLTLCCVSVFSLTLLAWIVLDSGDDRLFLLRRRQSSDLRNSTSDTTISTTTTAANLIMKSVIIGKSVGETINRKADEETTLTKEKEERMIMFTAWSPIIVICVISVALIAHAIVIALKGRIKPSIVAIIISAVASGCYSVSRLMQHLGVFGERIEKSLDWETFFLSLGFISLFSLTFALRAIHFLALELIPVQYRGRGHGLLNATFWLTSFLTFPLAMLFTYHDLVRSIAVLCLACVSLICGPFFCRFPNMSSTPLPQDVDDYDFCVESSRLYNDQCCCSAGGWICCGRWRHRSQCCCSSNCRNCRWSPSRESYDVAKRQKELSRQSSRRSLKNVKDPNDVDENYRDDVDKDDVDDYFKDDETCGEAGSGAWTLRRMLSPKGAKLTRHMSFKE